MQQLFNNAEVDELCGTTALNAFSRHFWYMTGELIPLCLFSSKFTTIEKKEIAAKTVKFKVGFQILFYLEILKN